MFSRLIKIWLKYFNVLKSTPSINKLVAVKKPIQNKVSMFAVLQQCPVLQHCSFILIGPFNLISEFLSQMTGREETTP